MLGGALFLVVFATLAGRKKGNQCGLDVPALSLGGYNQDWV